MSLPCFCLKLTIIHHLRLWPTHLIVFAPACSYYLFRQAPGAATIQGAAIQINMVYELCKSSGVTWFIMLHILMHEMPILTHKRIKSQEAHLMDSHKVFMHTVFLLRIWHKNNDNA